MARPTERAIKIETYHYCVVFQAHLYRDRFEWVYRDPFPGGCDSDCWSQRGGFHIQSSGEGLPENQWQIVDVVLLIPRLRDVHLHSRAHIFVKYSVDEMNQAWFLEKFHEEKSPVRVRNRRRLMHSKQRGLQQPKKRSAKAVVNKNLGVVYSSCCVIVRQAVQSTDVRSYQMKDR